MKGWRNILSWQVEPELGIAIERILGDLNSGGARVVGDFCMGNELSLEDKFFCDNLREWIRSLSFEEYEQLLDYLTEENNHHLVGYLTELVPPTYESKYCDR